MTFYWRNRWRYNIAKLPYALPCRKSSSPRTSKARLKQRKSEREGEGREQRLLESNTSSIFSTSIIRSTKQSVSVRRDISREPCHQQRIYLLPASRNLAGLSDRVPLPLLLKNVYNFSWNSFNFLSIHSNTFVNKDLLLAIKIGTLKLSFPTFYNLELKD